ncbi:phospholipase D family protein [Rhodanobacter sp. C05]|uniref:phospholipase D family protein n=1 Tax=Rhodanobacter sp. C05 TaxID=1945855 RepID=UPI0009864224|nr:phospholipase D family protein [Rhodanobacter sp. C05]OOG38125.1 phospholipase [Rhodanobacter sp. C05]
MKHGLRHTGVMAALAIVVLVLGACSSMRSDFVKRPSKALPPATGTPSGRYIHAEVDQHLDQSGFRLLTLSNNALMSRVALTDHAQHSIDLQYYIFNNDATGRLLAQRLLAAADRGVRVRLLLDAINLHDEIDMLSALNAHPNIKVRLFNPFHTRDPSMLSKTTQFLLDAHRLNRRMHNKSFIVDGNVAVIGGRNIGDAYFDAGNDTNFRDLDLIAIGPVVKDASHAFDEYWNCDAAIPVTAFHGKRASHYDLAKLRIDLTHDARAFAQSDYAQATLDQLPNGPSADRPGTWFWGHATLVADQPAKIDAASARDERSLRIGPQIKSMIDQAQQDVLLISPYFIPGDKGTQYLTGRVAQGVTVKVLTNSLASNDEAVVHAGYSRYRRALLEGGVDLYELRPAPGVEQPATAKGTSSGVSLHAKAIVVDQQQVFIGSMNMDPRSKLLNTEMGIIVDSPPLAVAVTQFFDTATQPTSAYHVTLTTHDSPHGGRMQWQDSDGGKPVIYHHDPETSVTRRLEVDMFRLMPIEGML